MEPLIRPHILARPIALLASRATSGHAGNISNGLSLRQLHSSGKMVIAIAPAGRSQHIERRIGFHGRTHLQELRLDQQVIAYWTRIM